MLVLGLLLILGAAVITAGAFFDAGETATVEVLGQTLTTTAAGVFVIGALTMLVFLLGVWCLMAAMSRGRRKRQERKAAKSQHRDSVRSLEEERESLRLENAVRERSEGLGLFPVGCGRKNLRRHLGEIEDL